MLSSETVMIGNDTSLYGCELTKQSDYYHLRWQSALPQKVQIYLHGPAGQSEPLAIVDDSEITLAVPNSAKRHYFYLQPEQGAGIWLADRGLDIEGAANTRDFGGYRTVDGRQVRWGRLFRTGHLSALSDNDHRYLEELDVSLICDFRRPDELQREPSRLDGMALTVVHLPIHPGSSRSFYENLQAGKVSAEEMVQFMEDINREFVVEQRHQFAEMFKLMLADTPQILIHCAVGKDRTGFAAAMILSALGVPEETVVHDYLLSNTYLPVDKELRRLARMFENPNSESKVALDTLRPMLEVREAYLRAAFDEIKQHYGSTEGFLSEGLSLTDNDIALLRAHYLY